MAWHWHAPRLTDRMASEARLGAGAVEGFNQEEELGGNAEVEVRGGGEGGVAAVVEDGLWGLDEGAERGGDVGGRGELLEEGGGSGRARWIGARWIGALDRCCWIGAAG